MILGQLARLESVLLNYDTDPAKLRQLENTLDRINHRLHNMENLMSALSDAVARLQADVDKALELLSQPAPDVTGAVAALNAMSDKLEAIEAPPPPAPTPVPTP